MKDYFISKRFWIKAKLVKPEVLDAYRLTLFNESACKPICAFFQDRPCIECYKCAAFKGCKKLFKEKVFKGIKYYGFPANNPKTIKKMFGLDYWKIPNKRPKVKFSRPIKFTGQLRQGEIVDGVKSADQVRLTNEWLEKRLGIICAPARTGKTYLSTYLATKLGLKTIVFAHKVDLLRQFEKAFLTVTDIDKSRIKLIKKKKELLDPKLDVALVNYQKFMTINTDKTKRDGEKKLDRYINDRYSFVIIDEAHSAGALSFCNVLLNLKCRYVLGLTATPDRKDSMTTFVKQAVGPVVSTGISMSLAPQIIPVFTHIENKNKNFVSIIRNLNNNKKRQDLICDYLQKDLAEGRQVIIPLTIIQNMLSLKDHIYKRLEDQFGNSFVDILSGKTDRAENIRRFDAGETKVLIASSPIIKQGIDFKSKNVDTMYNVVPMSASPRVEIGAPMHYQQTYRICSPVEGKRQPIVRWFIDENSLCLTCARSLFWKELVPRLKEYQGQPPRYKMTEQDALAINEAIKHRIYY